MAKKKARKAVMKISAAHPSALSEAAIVRLQASVPDWYRQGNWLKRVFNFKNRAVARLFVTAVEYISDMYDHHAEISGCYNRWVLALSTHSVGHKLTTRDFNLAHHIDRFLEVMEIKV